MKMFQAKVPEKLIQQQTEHQSLEAFRRYEHTSLPQLIDVSNVIGNDTVVPVPVLQTYQSTTTTSTTTTSESPSIVFKGCTFMGCSISMSGQPTSENKYENSVQELFQGIDIDDIFNDWLDVNFLT